MSAPLTKVEVPDIGDFDDVPVIELLVAVGDSVAVEDPLVTLESDKATMDVPAPFAGVIKEINVSVGDRVSQGSVLMSLEGSDGDSGAGEPAEQAAAADRAAEPATGPAEAVEAPSQPPASQTPAAQPSPSQPAQPDPGPAPARTNGGGPIYASPSARRLARELGVDLSAVTGSGRKGRITRDDVQNLADGKGTAAAAPATGGGASAGGGVAGLDLLPWPQVDFEKFGPVERVERSRIQRISAPNLVRNWVMIPHVTHNDEADITELEAWRKRLNEEHARDAVKFTMVSFLVAACVKALKEFPNFNSSLDGDELILKRYYNIGFAADTPGGLLVPVIKDADRKGLKEIATDLTELSGLAREGKLSLDQMRGATFTISSLGGIGGTSFTPIINAPEVAILGVTRAAMKPMWNGSEFVPRLMVPLSLSYDHRVIDGAAAARFVTYLVNVLSDLRRALL
ncbi:MAG TPA: dihydrolipoyllysine-residue acetyltransferase [Solirubrobacteraceae bacterium]|jgi:pyruvate dehydrogenase E2 component (dihydrolipoamide acetyltransferase)